MKKVSLLAAILLLTVGCLAAQPEGNNQKMKTTDPKVFKTLKWDTSQKGRKIDLSKYKKTFNDDFKKMNIVKEDTLPGPNAIWFSPGHGAYQKNSPLRKDGPFAIVKDDLRMRVEKVGKTWKGGGAVKDFHQYGGAITPEWVIMYFDRKEVARFPTMEEWKTPVYMLLDIVLHKKHEDKAVLPMDMVVSNVSAYLPKTPY